MMDSATPTTSPEPEIPRFRVAWSLIFLLHALGAAAWWWFLPHGFPISHPRFWANQVAPFAILFLGLFGLYALFRNQVRWLQAAACATCGLWAAFLVAGAALFPVSAEKFSGPLLVIVMVLMCCTWMACGNLPRVNVQNVAAAMCGLSLGSAMVFTQRPDPPGTRPSDVAFPTIEADVASQGPLLLELGERVRVFPLEGSIETRFDSTSIEIRPLLTFESRSPDGFWTAFAWEEDRAEPRRRLARFSRDTASCRMQYHSGTDHFLQVTSEEDQVCAIDAFARLEKPVYSHLNYCCELIIRGHRRLMVQFSPCQDVAVEPKPADYPSGKPVQLACLGADGGFRILRANSREKGPFTVLGREKLQRGDPLTLTLYDDDEPFCRIELLDWSEQVDVQLSPTAGWGLPSNAIELRRLGPSPTSPIIIWFTYAATSIGRGWDCVEHQAGVYRNRIQVSGARLP